MQHNEYKYHGVGRNGQAWCTIFGVVMKVTDRAILFGVDGEDEDIWIPKSVIEDVDVIEGTEIDLNIRQWFADEKGLSGY